MLHKLKALNSRIIFQFLDEVQGNKFNEYAREGLLLVKHRHNQLNKPRWAKVISVGKEVKNVKSGHYIFIENLGWTLRSEINGELFWNTMESKVLLVTEEPPTNLKLSDFTS